MRKSTAIAASVAVLVVIVLLALRVMAPPPVSGVEGSPGLNPRSSQVAEAPTPAAGNGLVAVGPSVRASPGGVDASTHREPAKEAEFSAIVLDARSGTPVSAVLSWGLQRAIADANGHLLAYGGSIEGPDRAELSAHGYETRVIESERAGPDRWKLGRILLNPASSVAVHVKDEHGKSIAGANISLARGRRSGPLWDGWLAGVTNSDGQLLLRATQGELILVSHADSASSASAFVKDEQESIELVLQRTGSGGIGFKDFATGQPLAGLTVDVISRKSVPGLHWTGTSSPDGRLPIALPQTQVIVNTPGPAQFVRDHGKLSTTITLELGSPQESTEASLWVEVSLTGGRWIRFVGPTGEDTMVRPLAETFRTSSLPDGQISELRVGTQTLDKGILNLEPYLDSGIEPLHAIVTAPGFRPFDSRHVGVLPQPGEIMDVRLEPLKPGMFHLTSPIDDLPRSDSRRSQVSRVSVWIFAHGGTSPIIRLQSDHDGFVRGVPNVSRTILVCLAPTPSAVIGELLPDDLYRNPPIDVPVPALSRLVVEFEPGEMPSEDLELVSNLSGPMGPRLESAGAIFENLAAGRYAVGTARQLSATAWMREFDPVAAFPLEILPGQELRIKADPSWARRPDDPLVHRGVVILDGPTSGLVVALSEQLAGRHFVSAPRYYSLIDATGGYEIPAGPDVLSLAAGTIERDTGAFIPLKVFAPGDVDVVAKGAHLLVHAAKDLKDLAILELKLQPREFKVIASLSRGLIPGEMAADFGWIPMGMHLIGPVGKTPTPVEIVSSGLLELLLLDDGTIVPNR